MMALPQLQLPWSIPELLERASTVPVPCYFLYLMAAGIGIPVSEDALCIFVGTLLPQPSSWSKRVATVATLYAGVTVSDMLTYSIGVALERGLLEPIKHRIFPHHGDGWPPKNSLWERALRRVQSSGGAVGFVQRWMVGVRYPIALVCGFTGVPFRSFASGVLGGAVGTLTVQLAIGYALRNNPKATGVIAAGIATYYMLGAPLAALASSVVLYFDF